jgi:WD40 repeat protein
MLQFPSRFTSPFVAGLLALVCASSSASAQFAPLQSVVPLATGSIVHDNLRQGIRDALLPALNIRSSAGAVGAMAVSPSGLYLATAPADGTVRVWDLKNGLETRRISGLSSAAGAVAINADDTILAAADDSGAKVWDLVTGKLLHTLSGHDGPVTALAFGKDANTLLTGGQDDEIAQWDLTTGDEARRFTAHDGDIRDIEVSNGVMVSGDETGAVIVWDFDDGEPSDPFGPVTDDEELGAVALSADGRYIATGTTDGDIKLWDTDGEEIGRFGSIEGPVGQLNFNADGTKLVSVGSDNAVTLWSVEDREEVGKFEGHKGGVLGVGFETRHGRILSAGNDGIVRVWDADSGVALARLISTTSGWAVIDSEGRFDGSLKAVRDIAWTGDEGEIEIDRMSERFYQAGLLAMMIDPGIQKALEEAVKRAEARAEERKAQLAAATAAEQEDIARKAAEEEAQRKSAELAAIKEAEEAAKRAEDLRQKQIARQKQEAELKRQLAEKQALLEKQRKQAANDKAKAEERKRLAAQQAEARKQLAAQKAEEKRLAMESKRIQEEGAKRRLAEDKVAKLQSDLAKQKAEADAQIAALKAKLAKKQAAPKTQDTARLQEEAKKRKAAEAVVNVLLQDLAKQKVAARKEKMQIAAEAAKRKAAEDKLAELRAKASIRKQLASADRALPPPTAKILKASLNGVPKVKLINPKDGTTVTAETIQVTVQVVDEGSGVDEIRLFHNGRVVTDSGARAATLTDRSGAKRLIHSYELGLATGENRIEVVAFSADRVESKPSRSTIRLEGPPKKPSLHVLAIGINDYKNPALNLNYGVSDATGVLGIFKGQENTLFDKVNLVGIFNENATRPNILKAIGDLRNSHPDDVIVVYMAGHGEVTEDGTWYFLPHEVVYPERQEQLKSLGLSSNSIQSEIAKVGGRKVILLIDSCKSGGALVAFRGFEERKALRQLARSTGMHIVAAAAQDQFAGEVAKLNHGVFTYTVLEALSGKADGSPKDDVVSVREMLSYVENRMPELSLRERSKAQYPVVDSRGMDFPVIVRR